LFTDPSSSCILLDSRTFETDVDKFFYTNDISDPGNGISLVGVRPTSTDGTNLSSFGHISLKKEYEKKGDDLSIIHQPLGGQKYISLKNFILTDFSENWLKYAPTALNIGSTTGGSTGSPVFNSSWELIGMHTRKSPSSETYRGVAIKEGIATNTIIKQIELVRDRSSGDMKNLLDETLKE
jgi:hypothetical protein